MNRKRVLVISCVVVGILAVILFFYLRFSSQAAEKKYEGVMVFKTMETEDSSSLQL